MFKNRPGLIAVLTPTLIFSLLPAAFAGNEAVQTPTAKTQAYVPAIDRPVMAPFKRLQGFAVKYRQRLRIMDTSLEQAKRVKSISPSAYKSLRGRLDHFLEMEPALARSNWKDSEVAAFDKDLNQFDKDFAAAEAKESTAAAAPSQSASTEKATAKTKTESKTAQPQATKK